MSVTVIVTVVAVVGAAAECTVTTYRRSPIGEPIKCVQTDTLTRTCIQPASQPTNHPPTPIHPQSIDHPLSRTQIHEKEYCHPTLKVWTIQNLIRRGTGRDFLFERLNSIRTNIHSHKHHALINTHQLEKERDKWAYDVIFVFTEMVKRARQIITTIIVVVGVTFLGSSTFITIRRTTNRNATLCTTVAEQIVRSKHTP